MSHSTLVKVFKSNVTHYREFKNGWASAPVIWRYLSDNYCDGLQWYQCAEEDETHKFWALAKNPDVPDCLRLAHAFCFDGAYIPTKYLRYGGDLLLEAATILNAQTKVMNVVNNWRLIAEAVIDLSHHKDARMIGIGLNCTSVSDVWHIGKRPPDRIFDCYQYINPTNGGKS